jgi:pimeloyl-ACP methyl ester carboxylesterase/DNA-binding winged helix-turn-helix (wHTH) protein
MQAIVRKIFHFGHFSVDFERGCVRRGEEDVSLRPKTFEVLSHLAHNPGRLVRKEELIEAVWPDVTVGDDSLVQCIRELRQILGDDAHRLIKTVPRRGYLLDASPSTSSSRSVRADGNADRIERLPAASFGANTDKPAEVFAEEGIGRLNKARAVDLAMLQQKISYCRTPEGVRLAYATAGSGPPLVKTANWLNHLKYDWESPVWRHVVRGLARDHTLIRYDARGNGLSDWDVDEISLDAWVRDLETVVDAAGIGRFPLLGMSQGCAISIAYATRHPDRVSHLILYGGFALGSAKKSPGEKDMRKAISTLMRHCWASDNPAFRQMFTGQFMPEATQDQIDFFNELQRRTTSPECAARYYDAVGEFDVTELLGKVTAPTLVMHVRSDARVPFESGRQLASGIPGARFVPLQGQNHLFLEHEPASERFFEEIKLFLGR